MVILFSSNLTHASVAPDLWMKISTHAFVKNDTDLFLSPYFHTEIDIAYIGQLIDRDHNSRTEICNDPIGLLILAAYQHLLKGGRLRNGKHNACCHRVKMREVSLPSPAGDENWVSWWLYTFCAAHLWKMMLWTMFWSTQNIVSSKIDKIFNFPIVHPFALCPTHTPIMFCLLAMTVPKLHLKLGVS